MPRRGRRVRGARALAFSALAALSVVGAAASCGARPTTRGASPTGSAPAVAVAPPCRPLDAAHLAPRALSLSRADRGAPNDAIRLGDVAFAPGAAPAHPRSSAAPFSANLGTSSYDANRSGTPARRHLARARDLPTRAWFGPDGIRASLLPDLDKIGDSARRERDGDRLAKLLEREQRLVTHDRLEHTGPTRSAAAFEREDACLSTAYEKANRDRSLGLVGRYDAEEALFVALGALTDRSPDEDVLLAWVTLQHTTRDDPHGESAIREARAQLVIDADDATRAAVTRVHLSRAILDDLSLDWAQPDNRPHVQRIVSLATDPATLLPARAELAYLETDDALQAAALEDVRAAIVAAGAFDGAGPLLLEVDAALGQARERAGDRPGAIRAYARCLDDAVPSLTEDDRLDPSGCAFYLAWALRNEGGVPASVADTSFPRVFAGRVGAELAAHTLLVLDRDLAGAAARFVVDQAYDATEAPLALTLLARLAATDEERRALVDRRSRDFGRASAWWVRETKRDAARGEPDHVPLLFEPRWRTPPEPTTEDEWRVELRDVRAPAVQGECTSLLLDEIPKLTVHIDTKGAVPNVKVATDKPAPKSVACVEDAVRLHFRSVPPAVLTLVLVR